MLERISFKKDEIKLEPLWFHKLGLMQTATGYGRRLKSEYLVKYKN